MKHGLKLFCLAFVTIVCFFFTENVSAESSYCYCYYKYNSNDAKGKYFLRFNIKFDTNSSDIYNWLYSSDRASTNVWLERGDPFRINPGPIISQERDSAGQTSCSIDACKSVAVYVDFDRNSKKGKVYACDNNCDGSICNKCSKSELKSIKKKKKLKVTNAGDTLSDTGTAIENAATVNIQSIVDYGNRDAKNIKSDTPTCKQVISKDLRKFLNNLLWVLSIIGIILLIVLTAIEFIKVLTGQDDEGLKKAFKNTIIRIFCVILLLLLPTIISSILTIVNSNLGGKIKIGSDGNVTCKIGE